MDLNMITIHKNGCLRKGGMKYRQVLVIIFRGIYYDASFLLVM